jgi:hypothetical protein
MHEEAVDWLETNFNPAALASGRFGSTADALDFVRALYGAGAKKVSVINVDEARLYADGGPYTDTLVAALPADPGKRAAVMAIYMEEVARRACNEGDPESGIKNDCLVFCWD